MNQRLSLPVAVLPVFLSILSAAFSSAHTAISVDVARGADDAYVVDASFDIDAPQQIVSEVLTGSEGVGKARNVSRLMPVVLDEVRMEIPARATR